MIFLFWHSQQVAPDIKPFFYNQVTWLTNFSAKIHHLVCLSCPCLRDTCPPLSGLSFPGFTNRYLQVNLHLFQLFYQMTQNVWQKCDNSCRLTCYTTLVVRISSTTSKVGCLFPMVISSEWFYIQIILSAHVRITIGNKLPTLCNIWSGWIFQ